MDCFIVCLSCPSDDLVVGVVPTELRARDLAAAVARHPATYLKRTREVYGFGGGEASFVKIIRVLNGNPVGVETAFDLT